MPYFTLIYGLKYEAIAKLKLILQLEFKINTRSSEQYIVYVNEVVNLIFSLKHITSTRRIGTILSKLNQKNVKFVKITCHRLKILLYHMDYRVFLGDGFLFTQLNWS